MKKLLTYYFILLLGTGLVFAQSNTLRIANQLYSQGQLDKARSSIDELIKEPGADKNKQVWYLRGFIYKDLFKKDPEGPNYRIVRDEATHAFKMLLQLDFQKTYTPQAQKALSYLSISYYNDAIEALKAPKYKFKEAEDNISKYKYYAGLANEPGKTIQNNEVAYLMNIAHSYKKLYDKDRTNKTYFAKVEEYYKKVLVVDPNDMDANFNLGILYYNDAVDLVTNMDFDFDIEAMIEVEAKTMELFGKSLPYMKKAHSLNPADKNVLTGLSGIYYGLNDFETSKEWEQKVKAQD